VLVLEIGGEIPVRPPNVGSRGILVGIIIVIIIIYNNNNSKFNTEK
jgi:hypothetical protein